MKALVTGGAGFIGSHLVDLLLQRGHQVTVLDDFSRGRGDNLAAAREVGGPRLRVVTGDIADSGIADLLERVRPEVVFHLAAQIDVRVSVADPLRDANVNVLGTINLAEAARRAGVRKIVFASSGGAIYGAGAPLPVTESAAVEPLSPYGVSKVAGELYLNALSRLHGMDVTHLAFANVYGPRQDPLGEGGVVAIFAWAMLTGRPTTLFGDGGNTRDYVYVDDVARALTMAAGDAGSRARFNIGTGVQTSDRQLHALIAQVVGAAAEPRFAPERPGDLRYSALDGALASIALGWKPEYDLTAGITATVAQFRAVLAQA